MRIQRDDEDFDDEFEKALRQDIANRLRRYRIALVVGVLFFVLSVVSHKYVAVISHICLMISGVCISSSVWSRAGYALPTVFGPLRNGKETI